MAPETILSVLTRANPIPRPWYIGPGLNTLGRDWIGFDNWRPWPEFSYKKLLPIFKDIVEAPWNDAPGKVDLSELDRTYGDEDGFEHQILSPETIFLVNKALLHARKLLKHPAQLHLHRRGRCQYGEDNRLVPDWVLVSDREHIDNGKFLRILPGDTKLSARWRPDIRGTDITQWQRPIQQILTYSNEVHCRYGFLITDEELVAFQFQMERVSPSVAATRGTRTPRATQTHQRGFSDISELSGSMQSMSMSKKSSGADSYIKPGTGFEYQDPKYQIVPWRNKGKNVLSVRLGLFYLCLMAGYGDRDVRTQYPQLNTWRQLDDGSFRHNTYCIPDHQATTATTEYVGR